MKWFYLKNIDTLFFRDGKPFWRGEETKANLNFPPPPRTFYGALRTFIIMNNSYFDDFKNNKEIYEVVGDENKLGELKIYGPFIYDSYNNIIFFPLPKDIMKKSYFLRRNFYILKPNDIKEFISNLPYKLKPVISENLEILEEIEERNFIEDENIINYLNSDTNNLNSLENKVNLYKYEYKVGIRINRNFGTVIEGNLYSLSHIRFREHIGFILGIENDKDLLPKSGILRLGGETRVAYFQEISEKINNKINRINEISKNSISNNRFKIVLLTPANFKNGWYPDFLEKKEEELIGKLPNSEIYVKLIGCILGKSKLIGGFDLKRNHPKSIEKYVPEGSVYYFEVLNSQNNLKDELIKYNFNSILCDENLKKEGFGQILIGGW